MSPSLAIVSDADVRTTPKTETVAARIQRLQAEARQLARDHIRLLSAQLIAVEEMAAEIAAGGAAYPDGVREFTRTLAIELESRVQTLEAIVSRVL